MFSNFTWSRPADWIGYAVIGMSILRILAHVYTWHVTIALYKRFPVGATFRMLLRRLNSLYAFQLFLPLFAAIAMYVLDRYLGRQHSAGILGAMLAIQLYSCFYQVTPPAVFLLSTSTPVTIALRHELERSLHPYRVIVLFDPARADPAILTDFQRNYLEWDNFRTRFGDWLETVHSIMSDTPVIVLDARVETPCVLKEAARINADPNIRRKTFFIVGPDNHAPALAAAGLDPAASSLQTVTEENLVAAIKATGLSRTAAPNLPPIEGLDTRARVDAGALQLRFDRARRLLEEFVLDCGYWFDRRNEPAISPSRPGRLKEAEKLLVSLEASLASFSSDAEWMREIASLYCQRALVRCELGRLSDAEADLAHMERHMANLPPSIWEPDEREPLESQRLFLSAELALVRNDKPRARDLLLRSRAIDQSLSNSAGVETIDKRLALC